MKRRLSVTNFILRARAHIKAIHTWLTIVIITIDLQLKNSCTNRWCFWEASTDLLNKASHLTTFCAWGSSSHLPVTSVQLMRPGIGRNTSGAVGDFAWHLGLFFFFFFFSERCGSLIVHTLSFHPHLFYLQLPNQGYGMSMYSVSDAHRVWLVRLAKWNLSFWTSLVPRPSLRYTRVL